MAPDAAYTILDKAKKRVYAGTQKTTADTNIDSLCPVLGGAAEMGCPCRCSSVHDVGNFAKRGTVVSVQRPGEYD